MPEPLAVTEEQFREALADAAKMSDAQLRNAAGAGTSRSYFVRSGDRILPLKAVLRLLSAERCRVGRTAIQCSG